MPRLERHRLLLGTWLIGKDWRDLFPSKRNTAPKWLLTVVNPEPACKYGKWPMISLS